MIFGDRGWWVTCARGFCCAVMRDRGDAAMRGFCRERRGIYRRRLVGEEGIHSNTTTQSHY